MLIRAKAPLRVSFAGGGTDVPPFPEQEGGLVLNATINRHAYGTLRPREDSQIQIESADFDMALDYDREEGPVFDADGHADRPPERVSRAAHDRLRGGRALVPRRARGLGNQRRPPGSVRSDLRRVQFHRVLRRPRDREPAANQ